MMNKGFARVLAGLLVVASWWGGSCESENGEKNIEQKIGMKRWLAIIKKLIYIKEKS